MIEWDETDVLTCLEVEPEMDRDRLCYRYTMRKDGLTLELIIHPYDGDVRITLIRPEQGAVADVWMLGCRAVRYVRTDTQERLLFMSHEGREHRPNLPGGLSLTVRPSLHIKIGDPLATTLGVV